MSNYLFILDFDKMLKPKSLIIPFTTLNATFIYIKTIHFLIFKRSEV